MLYFLITSLPLLWMLFECGQGQSPCSKNKYCVPSKGKEYPGCNLKCTFPIHYTVNKALWKDEKISSIVMTDGVNIVIDENSFPKTDELKNVEISDVVNLIVKNKAFTNLSSKKVQLKMRDIATVQIHEQAFQQMQGNLSVLIKDCSKVRMNAHAISSIRELTITDVGKLLMQEPEQNPRAKTPSKPRKPRTLKIKVSDSNIDQFPENFFPSSIREITITDCNVGSFRKNSIKAPNVENITIKETNIQVIESQAFTNKGGRYFKGQVLLKDLNIGEIQSNAMYFSGNNFSVSDTNMPKIHENGISLEMKKVLFHDSNFADIEKSGIKITIAPGGIATFTHNSLSNLPPNAIQVNYTKKSESSQVAEFIFESNCLRQLQAKSLRFDLDQTVKFKVNKNTFPHECTCNMPALLFEKKYVDSNNDLIDTMYKNSQCHIPCSLSKCFYKKNPRYNFVKISEYKKQMCPKPLNKCAIEGSRNPSKVEFNCSTCWMYNR